MTEYEYKRKPFFPGKGDTVEIPDNAVGVTMTTFGDTSDNGVVSAHYLVPVEDDP